MKKMKKFFAMFLALAMVLGMSVTTFAATNDGHGTKDDKGSITVEGIVNEKTQDNSFKVMAYQIVKADYSNAGGSFAKYQALYNGLSLEATEEGGINKVTWSEDDLNNVIQQMNFENGIPTTPAADAVSKELEFVEGTKFSASDLPVGSYLVVVTGAEQKVYSPIVVSISYVSSDNSFEDGTLNIENGTSWIKVVNSPTLVKTAATDRADASLDPNKETVNIGEDVTYTVTINPVPYYGGTNPTFNVIDTLSDGLVYKDGSFTIKVDGGTLGEDLYTFTPNPTITPEDGSDEYILNGITVDFVKDGQYTLNKLQGKTIVIEYKATVTADATLNDVANTNDARLNFSRNSNVDGDNGSSGNKTYNYTFDLMGKTEGDEIQSILTKTGLVAGATTTSALPNAVFTLYKDADCTDKYTNTKHPGTVTVNGKEVEGTTVSDEKGHMNIEGLAAGTYYLKETQAPTGYSINEHAFKIEIKAEYKDDGQLKSYEIRIDDELVLNNGTITMKSGEGSNQISGLEIKNTQISSLPSTGGIGTTIFTVGGCAIMIIAAGLYFSLRRKAVK